MEKNQHEALRQDIRFLGSILGEVLVHQGGTKLLDTVEKVRELTKNLRSSYSLEVYQEFKSLITSLDVGIRHQVIRAFAIYFQLVNLAEQNHRIRRKRNYERSVGEMPQPGSIEKSILKLKDQNISTDEIQEMIQQLSLELVITAHPTEAMRRAILNIHKRIAEDLLLLENPTLTFRERENLKEELQNEVLTLWQTDELRERKPTVIDEVYNGLYYFDHTLFEALPDIYQELERCLIKYYPEKNFHVPTFLRFGSWIGGDRDGNPSVTAEVTWQTLTMHRQLMMKKYKKELQQLLKTMSFSTTIIEVTDELQQSIQSDEAKFEGHEAQVWTYQSEPYRLKISYILRKLENMYKPECKNPNIQYQNVNQLVDELHILDRSLRHHYADYIANTSLKRFIRQVDLFGFHLATLDVRQHSQEHEIALTEILSLVNITSNYAELSEKKKVDLLTQLLYDPRPLIPPHLQCSEKTAECLEVFRTISRAHQEFGKKSITSYLISMARDVSDVLEVMVFAKEVGLVWHGKNGTVHCDLQSVPLFETIEDLHQAPQIMKQLFEIPIYRACLASMNNNQEIMLGYSDSNKDGGVLPANWELRAALKELTHVAEPFGMRIKFFHGRGGALGRGGMPLNRSILAQPFDTLIGGMKITEQGEVLSSRYSMPGIAYRSLEQATSALLLANMSSRNKLKEVCLPQWEEVLAEISGQALKKYQQLVFEDPDFLTFFKESTPLAEISELNIGSRPSKRQNSDRFEDLRAIPWVFAWTQSRYLFPAWYAAGSGIYSYCEEDPDKIELLATMYENFPFFRALMDSLQMALAKADLLIAREYTSLIKSKEISERIFKQIEKEYHLTKRIILKITKQQEILDNVPIIQESMRQRDPYVDPLSFLQVQLLSELRQLREQGADNAELLREVLVTINGIAAGLRNTG